MSASDPSQGRAGARLLRVVFWLGIALAPAAAALLLLREGTQTFRLAGAMCALAVVLIGLSVGLRRGAVPAEIEDLVLDEIDALNDDVREDITSAARATHKAFSEKVAVLTETVDALRAQVESLRAQLEHRAGGPAPAPVGPAAPHNGAGAHGGRGVVRHTETVQVTTRQTIVDPNEAARGTVYGGGRAAEAAEPAASLPRRGEWAEPAQQSWAPSAQGSWSEAASGKGAWSAANEPARAAAPVAGPTEESWTEKLLRERLADKDRVPGSGGAELRMGERRAAVRADGSGGTEVRIEDRWAAVRRDAAGADRAWEPERSWESTDRSVGRDAGDRGGWESDRGGWERIPEQRSGGAKQWWEGPRSDDSGRRAETSREGPNVNGRLALPASGSQPRASDWAHSGSSGAWGWPAEPAPERAPERTSDRDSRRTDDDDRQRWGARQDGGDAGGRGGRGRLVDFEVTDDRWR